jgi:DNA-binding transcriptional LysR family regulator
VLLPASHPLSGARSVSPADLAGDTWIRAHHGSAARLVDHVLERAGLRPEILGAGHGDEPVEAQAFVAAGHGVMVAHGLNVLIEPERIAIAGLEGAPVRHVQAAIAEGQRAPAALAALDCLRELGRGRSSS